MADLNDFYPIESGPPASSMVGGRASQNGNGKAAPAAVAGAPAVWVLAFVGLSLFLLHVE